MRKGFLSLALFAASASVSIPITAYAGVFSFLTNVLGSDAQASGYSDVHKTAEVPSLTPAVNLDPNPAKGGGDICVDDGVSLCAETGPSGTIADIEERPPTDQISLYVVRPADTISGIAKMYGVSVNTIMWANNLSSKTVRPGDTLVILPITGVKYTVKKGDTLQGIVKKYGGDSTEVLQYNGLTAGEPLAVGSEIIIPNGEGGSISGSTSGRSSGGVSIPSSGRTSPLHGAGGPNYDSYYIWPLIGGVKTQGLHGYNAVDLGARTGTPILAAAAGTVIIARDSGWNGGYGEYVVISHPNGTQTLYSHMSKVAVSPGQFVQQSQVIGYVGKTGEATGPHVHFEVRGAQNPFGP